MKKLFMFLLVICGLILPSMTLTSCDHGDVPSLKTDTTDKTNNDTGDVNDNNDADSGDYNPAIPPSDDKPSTIPEQKPVSNPNSLFTQSDIDWLHEIRPTFPTQEKEEITYTMASDIDVTVDTRVKTASLCDGTLLVATYTNVDNKLVLDEGYESISLASNKRYMMTFDYNDEDYGSKITSIKQITSNKGDVVGLSSNKTFVQLQISAGVSYTIATEPRKELDAKLPTVSSSTISIKVDKNIIGAKLVQGTNTVVEFKTVDGMLVAKNEANLVIDDLYSIIFEYDPSYSNRIVINEIVYGNNNTSFVFKSVNDAFANIYINSKTEIEVISRIIENLISIDNLNIEISDNIIGAKLFLEDKLVAQFDVNDETLFPLINYQGIRLETNMTYKLVFEYNADNLKITSLKKKYNNKSTVTLNTTEDYITIVLGSYTSINVEAS